MRSTLPLLLAGTCLAILPLLGPTGAALPTNLEGIRICVAQDAGAATQPRDWLGSLHGWQDSPLVLAWRASLAALKGKPSPCMR
ncbi:MAG: hypothetical protein JWR10_2037 [Rubritepida sp.]|nr:hypothetical protein [Rubritepida sp.]